MVASKFSSDSSNFKAFSRRGSTGGSMGFAPHVDPIGRATSSWLRSHSAVLSSLGATAGALAVSALSSHAATTPAANAPISLTVVLARGRLRALLTLCMSMIQRFAIQGCFAELDKCDSVPSCSRH
jgi:hypothetical protein